MACKDVRHEALTLMPVLTDAPLLMNAQDKQLPPFEPPQREA